MVFGFLARLAFLVGETRDASTSLTRVRVGTMAQAPPRGIGTAPATATMCLIARSCVEQALIEGPVRYGIPYLVMLEQVRPN